MDGNGLSLLTACHRFKNVCPHISAHFGSLDDLLLGFGVLMLWLHLWSLTLQRRSLSLAQLTSYFHFSIG